MLAHGGRREAVELLPAAHRFARFSTLNSPELPEVPYRVPEVPQ